MNTKLSLSTLVFSTGSFCQHVHPGAHSLALSCRCPGHNLGAALKVAARLAALLATAVDKRATVLAAETLQHPTEPIVESKMN